MNDFVYTLLKIAIALLWAISYLVIGAIIHWWTRKHGRPK